MYVILIHQRYRRTDRQTDGQTDDMRSQYRALHYSASRGKNSQVIQLTWAQAPSGKGPRPLLGTELKVCDVGLLFIAMLHFARLCLFHAAIVPTIYKITNEPFIHRVTRSARNMTIV